MNSAATQKNSTSAGRIGRSACSSMLLDLVEHALRREPLGELDRVLEHLGLGERESCRRRAPGVARGVLGVVVEALLDVGVVVREHVEQHEREQAHRRRDADREQDDHRSPTTLRANACCRKSSASRPMPWSSSRSENFGRMPVLLR